MNYIKFFFSTVLIFSTFFTAFAQDVYLHSQAEVDAFDKSITTINGDLTINGFGSPDPVKNLNGFSNVTTVGGHLEIITNYSLTNLDGLSQVTTVGGGVRIQNNGLLTNLDGLSQLTTVGRDLAIKYNGSLTNLDGLSGLATVGGDLSISYSSLTNLDGLSGLATVGRDLWIEENSSLTNCCGIQSLLSKAGAIKGEITIEGNATPCDSKATILSTSCDSPDEGEEVKESDYKKNLYSLTRWEAADCGNVANYKFAADNTYTLNGSSESGSYNVAGKTLSITPSGGTAKTYTITKMTRNAMHLNDASGKETVYGRKQHFSTEKLSGTNWKEQGGAHGGMRMKFLDATNVELITIGSKGSKMAATYSISSNNKKLTITFKDAAKVKAQGFSGTLVLNMTTFNYMMMKLNGGDGEICFNRTR